VPGAERGSNGRATPSALAATASVIGRTGQPRRDRRVAQHHLEVVRQQREHAEHADHGAAGGDTGAAALRSHTTRSWSSGWAVRDCHREPGEHLGGGPTRHHRPAACVDHGGQAVGDQQHTEQSDQERPLVARVVGDPATQQRTARRQRVGVPPTADRRRRIAVRAGPTVGVEKRLPRCRRLTLLGSGAASRAHAPASERRRHQRRPDLVSLAFCPPELSERTGGS
jgi:hypothetical protein